MDPNDPRPSYNGSRRGRWNSEIKRLRDENERLRGVLKSIFDEADAGLEVPDEEELFDALQIVCSLAHVALKYGAPATPSESEGSDG